MTEWPGPEGNEDPPHTRELGAPPLTTRLPEDRSSGTVTAILREIEEEFGPEIIRAQKAVRRTRQVLRVALALQRSAERFCRYVRAAERPEPDTGTGIVPKTGLRQDYLAAGTLLRRYLRGEVSAQEMSRQLDIQLASVQSPPWTLSPIYGGSAVGRVKVRFTLDKGEGATGAPHHLAQLLADGLTLDRFRVCQDDGCDVLFVDSSPRADRSACCKRHKDRVNARRYRQRQRARRTKKKET